MSAYLERQDPPVALHALAQHLVNQLHAEGRQTAESLEASRVAMREALYWLDNNAPGRAVESLQRALAGDNERLIDYEDLAKRYEPV